MDETKFVSKFDLITRKNEAKKLIKRYKISKDVDLLDKAVNHDNTNQDIYLELLKNANNNNNYKLKERSFDILDKKDLKQLNIIKLYNHKEIYFHLLHYLENISLDEEKDSHLNFENENFVTYKPLKKGKLIEDNESIKKKQGKDQKNCKIYESEEEEIEDQDDEEEEIEDQDEEEEEDYETDVIKDEGKYEENKESQNMNNKKNNFNFEIEQISYINPNEDELIQELKLKNYLNQKENFDIKKLLILKEKIKIKEIKKKFKKIYKKLFNFLNCRNNYPDFESEYFYFNCIRYTLDTFRRLKYKKFISKIIMTKDLEEVTDKIENGKITHKLTKVYYYYLINTQYCIDVYKLKYLEDYNENELFGDYAINENSLFKGKEKLVDNIDNYSIKDVINLYNSKSKEVADNRLLMSPNKFYNINGLLKIISFNKEDGDKFWKEFLSSHVLDEIQFYLYNNKENIFKEQQIIKLFQDNSYYFQNLNQDFTALSHKDLFFMFFQPRKVKNFIVETKETNIEKMVGRAFNKVDIQHEWGHTSSSFLFFGSKTDYFDIPKRKIKLTNENGITKERITSEGGETVEILLYGRIIDDLTAKEAIYILNDINYQKNLKDFLSGFMNLKYIELMKVFKDALKNENIDQSVKDAYYEYQKKNKHFKEQLNYYSFKAKGKKFYLNDPEKTRYKFKPSNHLKALYKAKHRIIYCNKDEK